ncbi:DUF3107 domain-containing protein [Pontimonas sp.]|uniref:DUF3107 domain-containing protein n=1 Tax=Pontimonas sp. TaxID=2304492 RepID=UPI002870736B|nr:DUF3107 domain-containing protein [Pontimonas sp.]MDR9396905.1 DUF3107 domain-containing protein [Pontimonas sp.]MDR9434476.1 DUF3107 domain-containing protein [Pontimonas sp.]
MEIRIGITHSTRELSFETDKKAADVEKDIAAQLAKGDDGIVRLEDQKGHVYLVPVSTLAYIEMVTESARKVGFAP